MSGPLSPFSHPWLSLNFSNHKLKKKKKYFFYSVFPAYFSYFYGTSIHPDSSIVLFFPEFFLPVSHINFFPNQLWFHHSNENHPFKNTHFMCQPDWAMRYPDTWLNFFFPPLGVSVRMFLNEISIWVCRLSEADGTPLYALALSSTARSWIELKPESEDSSLASSSLSWDICLLPSDLDRNLHRQLSHLGYQLAIYSSWDFLSSIVESMNSACSL